ncbi:hypothetical protein Tco_1251137, partial [Tanacetum coccineum]
MASSSSSSSYLIRFHRGGVFVRDLFSYDYEMLSEIRNVDMAAMNFVGLVKLLVSECSSDIKQFFYHVVGLSLELGLRTLKNDEDLAKCCNLHATVLSLPALLSLVLAVLTFLRAVLTYRIYNGLPRDDYAEKDVSAKKDVSDEDNLGDQWPIHDPTIKWKLMRHVLGEKYESPEQLKRALVFYALANGYKLYYEVNNPRRLLAKCCRDDKDNKYPFRTFEYGTLITSNWIARNYAKKIMMNPCIKVKEIIESILKKYKCKVKISQARRGKMKALQQYETCLEDHYGMLWSYASEILNSNLGSACKMKALQQYKTGLEDHYGMLWSYASEILNSNPGSTCKMSVDSMPDGKNYFSRFYVCFKGLREGWLQGCRRLIGLDGCFLKTICKGELLSAGIIESAKPVMPLDKHRQYARHIYANFRKKYIKVQYRNLFWKAAKATYPTRFNKSARGGKVTASGGSVTARRGKVSS